MSSPTAGSLPEIGCRTDVGRVREANEDSVGHFQSRSGRWVAVVVCDGMGGYIGGARASGLAVSTLGEALRDGLDSSPAAEALPQAVQAANATVHAAARESPELAQMGTTCALLATDGQQAWIAHVGDSRVYRVRGQVFERMTRDHSAVQKLVDAGMIDERAAREHPDSNVLSRCVGREPTVEVDLRGPVDVERGDRFVLCSDGLTGLVADEEIAAMVLAWPPQEAADRLVKFANDRGGHDNISVQVVYQPGQFAPTGRYHPDRTRRPGQDPSRAPASRPTRGGLVRLVVGVVLLSGAAFATYWSLWPSCGDAPEAAAEAVAPPGTLGAEVTVQQYEACVKEGDCAPATPAGCGPEQPASPSAPQRCVSRGDARRYCAHVGARLPGRAELEAAATAENKRSGRLWLEEGVWPPDVGTEPTAGPPETAGAASKDIGFRCFVTGSK